MKLILTTLTLAVTLISNAQSKFEKGYFIDNQGNKTECLIKNIDWKYNPTDFKYKLSESDAQEQHNSIANVKEFAIIDKSKFIKETVFIDQSSQNSYNLTTIAEPVFKEETVFLKVLVEGNSNLYYYESENTNKFFYTYNNKTEQLVFKRYATKDNDVALNEGFKRQLFMNFKCTNEDRTKIEKLKYNDDDLVDYFTETNNCKSGTTKETVVANREKFETHLKINVLGNSIGGNYNLASGNIRGNYDLENKNTITFGFEAEVVFPFHNKTWSVIFDPSYISKKDVINIYKPVFINPNYTISSEVFLIRLPLGIRKYFPINENNKVFANASVNINVSKTKIDFDRDRPAIDETHSTTNFSLGIGYQFKRYSAELRYFSKTDITQPGNEEDFYISQTSIKLGYRLF
ncbi:hypothetical protein ABGT15_03085 [Flavobacterium enshiense]|uniref:outer membrane beta-barrel protein n=1 Tax=Flavobacterium enshiense TaxID=1341165 RepID=UPI00345C9429